MSKKKQMFLFLIWHDLLEQLGKIAVCMGFILSFGVATDVVSLTDNLFVIVMTVIGLGYFEFDAFLTLRFCRKRFYQYQVMLSAMRALELACVRSVYQVVWQSDFVHYFIEDTGETLAMYHSVSFLELFITNTCIFVLVGLVHLITKTWMVNPIMAIGIDAVSPQKKLRIQQQKERNPVKWRVLVVVSKMIGLVVVVAADLSIIYYYKIEMQADLAIRLMVLAGLIIICGILYLIGRKRYRPEYV